MKENNYYKGLWLFAFVLVTTMFSAIIVYGNEEQTMQLPVDKILKVPLSEVYDEGNEADTGSVDDDNESDGDKSITEEEDLVVVPRTVRRDSSSIHAVRESDGSITYLTRGTVLQHLGTNMIVNWEDDTFGIFYWDYLNVSYCAFFGEAYGYHLVNLKVME